MTQFIDGDGGLDVVEYGFVVASHGFELAQVTPAFNPPPSGSALINATATSRGRFCSPCWWPRWQAPAVSGRGNGGFGPRP